MVLAAASVVGGALLLGSWITGLAGAGRRPRRAPELPLGLTALGHHVLVTLTVIVGVGIAWLMYGRREVSETPTRGSVLTRAARADLYGDRLNETVLMRPASGSPACSCGSTAAAWTAA
jgi:NADH-quinone oxidoreductase subunit L